MRITLAIAAVLALTPALAAAGDTPMPELSATPTHGKAPLSVTFTGGSGGAVYFGGLQIEFGDGESADFCRPGRACRDATASHVYAKPGTYTARLVGRGEGAKLILKDVTVRAE